MNIKSRNRIIFLLVWSLIVLANSGFSQLPTDEKARYYINKADEQIQKMHDYHTALAYADSIVLRVPDNSNAYKFRAELRSALKEYSAALEDYEMMLRLHPGDTIALEGKADVLRYMGKYREALPIYSEAIKRYPTANAYFGRGACYYATGKYQAAVHDYSKGLEDGSTSYLPYMQRGMAYVNLGEADLGIADLRKALKEEYNNDLIYRYLGMAYMQKADSVQSRYCFQKAERLAPQNTSNAYEWALAEMRFGNFKKADELFGNVYKTDQGKNLSPAFYYFYAVTKANTGDTTAALKNFDKSISLLDTVGNTYFIRASILMNNELTYRKQIISDLHQALKYGVEDKNQIPGIYLLAAIVEFNAGKLKEALSDLNAAIQYKPGEADLYLLRYAIHLQLEQPKKMVQDVDKALSMDISFWGTHVLKASMILSVENKEYDDSKGNKEACSEIETAVKQGGQIDKQIVDFICKGKELDLSKVQPIQIPIRSFKLLEECFPNDPSIWQSFTIVRPFGSF